MRMTAIENIPWLWWCCQTWRPWSVRSLNKLSRRSAGREESFPDGRTRQTGSDLTKSDRNVMKYGEKRRGTIVKSKRRQQSTTTATGTDLSVPVDHHLLCKAHFNWITPQTSSLLRWHDGWLGVLRDEQRRSINWRVRTLGAK